MLRLLDAFPLLLVVVIIYSAFVLVLGAETFVQSLGSEFINIKIISGDVLTFSKGDVFILLTIFVLFVEVLKSTHTGSVTLLNHGLSTAVMVVCMILLLIARGFGNATFLFITLMTVFDVVGGFIITIAAARRDFSIGR